MVAGLIARHPDILLSGPRNPLLVSPEAEGVACQIQAAGGEVLLQTSGVRGQLLDDARPGFSTRAISNQQWRVYTLEQNGMYITTADRMTERVALTNSIILVMVVPFTLALLGGLAVLRWGVRGGLRPLQALNDQLRRRTPENLDPVQVERAPAELTPVVDTLNSLFTRVANTVAWEQRFANSAAHEFRTPLTGIKTHLQVARRVSGERQQQALENAEKGVIRLQMVTEEMLMLARMERQGSEIGAGCPVTEMIEGALEHLSGRDRLQVHNPCPQTRMAVPAALAVVVLRNLVENALKHSAGPCELVLQCDIDQFEGDRVHVLVRDQGPDGDSPSERNGPASHGLGLVIVEMVVAQYGGSLVSEGNSAGGMDWKLTFPATH